MNHGHLEQGHIRQKYYRWQQLDNRTQWSCSHLSGPKYTSQVEESALRDYTVRGLAL